MITKRSRVCYNPKMKLDIKKPAFYEAFGSPKVTTRTACSGHHDSSVLSKSLHLPVDDRLFDHVQS